ncbi:hypothetical protein [Lysinibacillus sp. UBA6686]|nr:hypothetical protein [Lysinibacillus sp. UBA6686]
MLRFRAELPGERPMSRLGQQEVGHEGVVTGRDDFSLCSPKLLAPWSHL